MYLWIVYISHIAKACLCKVRDEFIDKSKTVTYDRLTIVIAESGMPLCLVFEQLHDKLIN